MTKEMTKVLGEVVEAGKEIDSMKICFSSCRGRMTSIQVEKIVDILERVNFDNVKDEDGRYDIVIPSYQRNQLKSVNKSFVPSLFASLILGIGVPSSIIIALNEMGLKELVDALQRLSALRDIISFNVPFNFKKINKNNFTEEEKKYLIKFDGMTLEDFRTSEDEKCKEIYSYINNLQMAIYSYEGFSAEERIYLFYKFNASSTKLSKDEMNHALYEGTGLYKMASAISKRVDEGEANDRVRLCLQNLVNSDVKFVRTNYVLKMAYVAFKKDHLQDDSYSTGFSKVLVEKFLKNDDANSANTIDDIGSNITEALKLIQNYGLLNIKDKISISPVMSEDGSADKDVAKKATFCFLCLFQFALQYGDTIKNYLCETLNPEDGKLDIFDVFNTYIKNNTYYKTSKLAVENYQHTDTTGKVFVNAYVWNEMIKHAAAQEDFHETFSNFDFKKEYDKAKSLCADGRGRKKSK